MEKITPQVLLGAYTEGVFPMAENGEIYWFSPTERGLIPLDELESPPFLSFLSNVLIRELRR
ncbi:leucyl/phenylalanyl-tRNA--protein transferase family protein [bacterium]|nr:leucyl/phenylalanyl-tRNA--protein transferase family protein [bacterium]